MVVHSHPPDAPSAAPDADYPVSAHLKRAEIELRFALAEFSRSGHYLETERVRVALAAIRGLDGHSTRPPAGKELESPIGAPPLQAQETPTEPGRYRRTS